jgi:hypothetical protein
MVRASESHPQLQLSQRSLRFQLSKPAHGAFMILSPKVHVPNAPAPVNFGGLKPPEKSLTFWLESKPAPRGLEYENPDLTQPSVSSF